MDTTVCIFAKPPLPGRVKTRLAARIGDCSAAKCADAFLRDTVESARRSGAGRVVVAATETFGKPYLRDLPIWLQPEGDLGHRIEMILTRALSQSSVAIALGADTPGLPPEALVEARRALQSNDAVIGPCADGGFYLLGLKKCPAGLLRNVRWSQRETCGDTLRRLREAGLKTQMLDPWFDVDSYEDLLTLWRMLARCAITAPHSRLAFEEIRDLRT